MRRLYGLFLSVMAIALFTGCATGPVSSAPPKDTLNIATLVWPPFISPDLPNGGPATEIVVTGLREAGYGVNVHYMPWKDAISQTMEGKYDGIYPAYFSEERFKKCLVSEPFMAGPVMLCARADRDLSYSSLESLKPYRIGIVAGYVNAAAFDAADDLNKVVGESDEKNLIDLAAGRLDFVVVDQMVGTYIISKNPETIGPLSEFVFLEPRLGMRDSYLMLPRSLAESMERKQDFDAVIRSMREKKRIERILRKHGFR